ncbi:glucosamine-6-phosphate deaminase [Rossellomorea vietnamensis]|uniref:glucosamine-6-phosphate deaminase n=1 Tax=Rossellomorea vietnamensis TaxID=218284 RepID=UPI001E616353|nr:glucosamine-6-phosphate deaminase [Rossellomorea vietnamensis]MCC5800785.1 glucosamine-6-phosphate deaminase [Rossellomorea vietnamensis]
MKVIVNRTYEDVSHSASQYIQTQIKHNPHSVLGLATGSTPLGLYKKLVMDYRAGHTDYSKVSTINLDEYVGLSKTHPQSYHTFMRNNLFSHINIIDQHTHIPNGQAMNLGEECARYNRTLELLGPPDILILGIGENGHIGFNEPGTSFNEKTQVVKLKESTRRANARLFSSIHDVPKEAITMGIESILSSTCILLLATGERKNKAIQQLLEGKIHEEFPASALHLHPNVTLIVDESAYNRDASPRQSFNPAIYE